MSDFQDRGTAPGGPTGPRGPDGGDTAERSVHQVVFRWDGNHGRQDTGMTAVAHSCVPERAAELGRELGPLLWVSGAAAERPSVVRTLSLDGDVLLVQRRPTTDRSGRPSTVSHVLIGDRGVLQPEQCLGLAYGGWRERETVEQLSGRQPRIERADLDRLVGSRQQDMLSLLPGVEHALILVTAELLRDPTQRVSLLLERTTPRGWPDREQVPLVYLGLFLLFGPWLKQPWTFATCDAVDTHALRLMSVPHWEPDSGGSGPLARVMGRTPEEVRFEHRAASQLVDHLLAHREARPGVPQLVDELADGASLDWERRSVRLKRILGTRRSSGTGTTSSARRVAGPRPNPEGGRVKERDRGKERGQDQDRHRRDQGRAWEAERQAGDEATPTPAVPEGSDAHTVHRELRAHRPGDGDGSRRGVLPADLRALPDELLLRELRSGELPSDSLELVLDELGRPDRAQGRDLAMRHELCAEVLGNDLYFAPQGQSPEHASRKATADRAADLFTWAVAPLARDERYLPDLKELMYRMIRHPHPAAGNWLRQCVIEPRSGQYPDLPPVVWSEIVREVMSRNGPPLPAYPPPPSGLASAAPPLPSVFTPDVPTGAARLSDMLNKPGCLIGALLTPVALLVVLVLMLVL
ncbi:hypothetical protein [Streptomyces silvensis]|uniref:Uncharacterized protein n=1 Tax=Streptomyces silvensis TaxID=1765722 RepID=A0A0W7WSL6_9ACTN|nr:hypothetical protein [Streptomyces silvensis]KUF13569.1 hypothetical protein AT728_34515 [Streptomyces silvensis]